jgi:hypothetical protein
MMGMDRPTASKCQASVRIAASLLHVHGVTMSVLDRGPFIIRRLSY